VDEIAIEAQLPRHPVDEVGVALLVVLVIADAAFPGDAAVLDPLLAPHQELGARAHGAIGQVHHAVAIDELPHVGLSRRGRHGQEQR
jgi:hypothetical protein